ncbi:MAG: hypothetical protein KGM18_08250 [Sphingomonadales bacterium]|nr:hypothetical protein [Sphingomonadales bacterium]
MTALTIRAYLACLGCLVFAGLYGRFGQGAWGIPPVNSWYEPSLLGLAAYLFILCRLLPDRYFVGLVELRPTLPQIVLAVFMVCAVGNLLVLQGFHQSRDEQMAVFDAAVFRSGRMFAPIPPLWQPDAKALNLDFMLPADPPLGWISSYLPMNAVIRAGFSLIGAEPLATPIMAAGAIALLWSVAGRLWPDDRGARVATCAILVGSGQFIMSGMTAYAMTAHLLCNLVWLRLFLMRRRWADGLAILVGFVATGLHQPVFHPLFVLPFMVLLLVRREWTRLACFAVAYLAIAAFWMGWPLHVAGLIVGDVQASGGGAVQGVSYLDRLHGLIHLDLSSVALQAYNIAGFFAWQHILLLPLLVLGWRAARGNEVMMALAAGLVLPFVVMLVILPFQGFGYGYRYAHGVLGNAALLAGWAWHRMGDKRLEQRRLLARTTLASVAVLLPFQMWSVHSSFRSFVEADRRITASGTDLVVLDNGWGHHVENLVYNAPDLDNRPIRLIAQRIIDPDGLAHRHCGPGTSVAFGSTVFYTQGFGPYLPPGAATDVVTMARLRRALTRAGCRVETID